MRTKKIINILKDSLIWIFLIIIINAFFIFLAWLAYNENFYKLLTLMIIFSIMSLFITIYIIKKKNDLSEEAFLRLLENPSIENENDLLRFSNKNDAFKITELSDRLREQNKKIQTINMDFNEYEGFIETWIHEIKTPISLMTLVLDNRRDEISKEALKKLDYAKININDNVERILFYSRLNLNQKDSVFKEVDIAETVKYILYDLSTLIYNKEIEIIENYNIEEIYTDEKSIKFIINQILINAIKYSKNDKNSFIKIETNKSLKDEKYYLEISDNGYGVLESDLPFIFNKGFTGNNMNEKQSTGIGLYLVRELCRELNIDIEIYSKINTGFKIKLIFPSIKNI